MPSRMILPNSPPALPLVLDARDRYLPAPDSPLQTEFSGIVREGLCTGDLAVGGGLQHLARIECKWSIDDLAQCCGNERARFSREIVRLRGFESRLILVAASWGEIEMHQYRSRVSPDTIFGSLIGWAAAGVPFVLAGSRYKAEAIAARFLTTVIRRRWRELRAMAGDGREASA